MINDFKFKYPFVQSNMILQIDLNLDHEAIAHYFRLEVTEQTNYTTYFDKEWNAHVMRKMPYRQKFLEACYTGFDLWCKERKYEGYDPADPQWDPRNNYGDWVSVWREGNHHVPHNHPRALVAGTYYPYADEHSCPTNYQPSDHSLIAMSEPALPYESYYYRQQPVTGTLYLWPAWMTHQIGPQREQAHGKERVAVSLNMDRS